MRYSVTHLDNVRWRSEVLRGEIPNAPSAGDFFRGSIHLGWSLEGNDSKSLHLELDEDEAVLLHQLLGERLGSRNAAAAVSGEAEKP